MTIIKAIQEIPQDMEKSKKHFIKKIKYIYKQMQNSLYSMILMLKTQIKPMYINREKLEGNIPKW